MEEKKEGNETKDGGDGFNFLQTTVRVSDDLKEFHDHFEQNPVPNKKKSRKLQIKIRKKSEAEESIDFNCFNERFQVAIEKMRSTKKSKISNASDLLINVAQDFLWSAKTYGKIIISEYSLPDHYKTIKPYKGTKGKLGGLKYFHQGLFYLLYFIYFIVNFCYF